MRSGMEQPDLRSRNMHKIYKQSLEREQESVDPKLPPEEVFAAIILEREQRKVRKSDKCESK